MSLYEKNLRRFLTWHTLLRASDDIILVLAGQRASCTTLLVDFSLRALLTSNGWTLVTINTPSLSIFLQQQLTSRTEATCRNVNEGK